MKTNKTIKALLAGLVLSTGVFLASPTISEAKSFTDLNKNGSHTEAVTYLNSLNAFDYKAGNTLNGNSSVSRAEVSKVLYNLYKDELKKVRTYNNNFKDVTSKTTYSKEVIWSYEVGIFDGSTATKFDTASKLTRAQMAKILVNTFNLTSKGNITFKDVKANHWAKGAISVLASNGITNGDGKGNFLPSSNVTLNQLSSFIFRLSDSANAVTPVVSTPVQTTPVVTKPVTKPAPTTPVVDNKLKSLEELKALTAKAYSNPAYQPKDVIVYSAKDYEDALTDYTFTTMDISEDVEGYTTFGRHIEVWVQKLANGTYENTIKVTNELDEEDYISFENRMDKAEAYIVANYKLDTDYDVVLAVNDFIGSQMSYGTPVSEDHEYLVWGEGTTVCTGYADFAANLYKRFGIESRYLRGDAHAWNAVKIGGYWFHTDATGYDSADKKNLFYVAMNNSERSEFVKSVESTFKATDVKYDPSMAKPYTYKKK